MTDAMTLPLADPRASLETVGGKGASLARLSRAGLPVPDGFHISTAAYQWFVSTNQLQPRIRGCLAPVDPDQFASLESAAQAIQALFLQSEIPQNIQVAIAQAYAALPGEQPQVAVRSSATAEDLPDLSFAGQHETYLNIHDLADVLDAVKRCWASLWTARAIGYRIQHKVAADSVRLAVTLQMLVPAQAAGVMFTANPANGQRDQVMIAAAWGLGEAVVSGLVTPDILIVAKAEGKLLSRQTAHKETMTVLCENGTAEQIVPETMRDSPVLSGPEAIALARFGARIEALYAMPMDIEWALAEGKIAILQARPINALPEPQLAPPTEWPLPDPKGKYIRASILDLLPDPLTPLFATLGGDIIEATTRRLYAWFIGEEDLKLKLFDTINDYGYMNTNLGGWMMLRMGFRSLFRIKWMFKTAHSRLEAARDHYRQVIRQRQGKPLAELRAVELLDGVRQLTAEMAQIYTVLQSGPLPAASLSEAIFTQVYNRLIKKKGDPEPVVYLMGFVSMPIRAELALYDLAQWAGGMNSLSAHLTAASASRLAAELTIQKIPLGVDAEQWAKWRQRFKTHLASYGHLTYNLDFANAVAADDPAPLLETCRMYLMGKASSPQARVQTLKAQREKAVQALRGRLHGLKRGFFDKLLRSAQLNAPRREDGFADLGLGYPLLRRMLCEFGRRLVQAGALAQPADVYWLTAQEVDAAAAALDKGQPLPALWDSIHPRRGVWKAEQRAVPPVTLPIGVKILGLAVEKFTTPSASPGQDVIKGFGVSQGQVTAPACVLRGPEDFAQMRPGDVLVAPIITPAWTPLFALASAIVTDIGGPLSHSSIVAREYGIPAVLGTFTATRRITSGQMIIVDGEAGTVNLVASQPAQPPA